MSWYRGAYDAIRIIRGEMPEHRTKPIMVFGMTGKIVGKPYTPTPSPANSNDTLFAD